jgi:hypothetical protein
VTNSSSHVFDRLTGMIRTPRATLAAAIAQPRSFDLGLAIVIISAICSVGFLLTDVGRLAALDQQVRQLESFGTVVTDDTYARIRSWAPYRPAMSAAFILIGWPLLWMTLAAMVKAVGDRVTSGSATFAQVLTVMVHASAVFALRSIIAAPINYNRESLGSATSLSIIMPAFGESTFPARLLGTVDLFVLWWMALVAIGLGMLYGTRTLPIARWLLGAYAAGACALALTQALRGGI